MGEEIKIAEGKKEKTPEELKAERLKRYTDSPDRFIEISEVICMAIKSSQSALGVSVMVGDTKRSLMDIAQVELTHMLNKVRLRMDMAREMKAKPAPGSMRNFANKIMRR